MAGFAAAAGFGTKFNQNVDAVVWPLALQELTFGDHFNQPIERTTLTVSLQLGLRFGHAIEGVA